MLNHLVPKALKFSLSPNALLCLATRSSFRSTAIATYTTHISLATSMAFLPRFCRAKTILFNGTKISPKQDDLEEIMHLKESTVLSRSVIVLSLQQSFYYLLNCPHVAPLPRSLSNLCSQSYNVSYLLSYFRTKRNFQFY